VVVAVLAHLEPYLQAPQHKAVEQVEQLAQIIQAILEQ
jgi:hypothetical protein